jgi:hypothetical protein
VGDDDPAVALPDAGDGDARPHDAGRHGVAEHLEQLGPGEHDDIPEPP